MPLTLAEHLALIEDELAASAAAPLSARKAMLVATLLDAFADRAFAAWRGEPVSVFDTEDIAAYRAAVARFSPEMGTIFAVVARPETYPRIAVRTVNVPFAEYGQLSVQDYMVSLYNQNTVQRLMVVEASSERPAHPVLRSAMEFWRCQIERGEHEGVAPP